MKKSFTLIEILVAIGIFFILVAVTFSVMNTGVFSWLTGDVAVEMRQEIIKAFIVMDKELKETAPAQISLGAGSTSSSLTFKLPQDKDGDGTVLDSAGNIEWSENIIYELNASGEIIRRTASGASRVLARNIVSLQFTRPAATVNMLQVDITAQKENARSRLISDSGQIVVKMRN